MRTAFINALNETARRDARVCLVVGDLGYSVIDDFARNYPDQFVNAGVAEQDMTGIATGMAMSGKIVVTYSIANFATLRCLEQIRNDICYHGANVKIVAVGGGFAYESRGISHHATEDRAIMRALPGLIVLAPADPVEADLATRAVLDDPRPCYLRLGKAGEAVVHREKPNFQLGKAITFREGRDLSLITTGAGMLAIAASVADGLARQGLEARVLSMHTISPIDVEAVASAAAETSLVVTLEEHSVVGGLGSAVAEILAEMKVPHARLERLGLQPSFAREVGDQAYLRRLAGLDVETVRERIEFLLQKSYGLVS